MKERMEKGMGEGGGGRRGGRRRGGMEGRMGKLAGILNVGVDWEIVKLTLAFNQTDVFLLNPLHRNLPFNMKSRWCFSL